LSYIAIIFLEEQWISRSFNTAVPSAHETIVSFNSMELGDKHTPVPLCPLQGGIYDRHIGTGAGFSPEYLRFLLPVSFHQFLGAFEKLRKATIIFMSTRLPPRIEKFGSQLTDFH
jgi:hypothetical protein